jgi:hypothetical protein
MNGIVCAFAFASSEGNAAGISSRMPPELNAPIQAKRSSVFRPVVSDSAPPMERPAIARAWRSFATR